LSGRADGVWPRGPAAASPRRSHLLRPEDSCYTVGPDGHHLTIYRARVDTGVVELVREAPVTLAVSFAFPLMVLLYRFHPRGPRGNAPFAWHLWPPEYRMMPRNSGTAASRSLTIRLVSIDDFQTRAVRRVQLSAALASGLRDTICTQASSPFDPVAYARAVAATHLDGRTLWAQQERIVASMAALWS
jgi:hypothetical protein